MKTILNTTGNNNDFKSIAASAIPLVESNRLIELVKLQLLFVRAIYPDEIVVPNRFDGNVESCNFNISCRLVYRRRQSISDGVSRICEKQTARLLVYRNSKDR